MPAITNPGQQTFYLNSSISKIIEISPEPSGVSMEGLQAKMYYERGEDGATILGKPDRLVALSENRRITVNASTSGGDHQESFLFNVEKESFAHVYYKNNGNLYKFNLDGDVLWTSESLQSIFSQSTDLKINSKSDAYVFNDTTNKLYKINSIDGSIAWTYNTQNLVFEEIIIDYEDSIILVSNVSGRMYKINKEGVLVWSNLSTPTRLSGVYSYSINLDFQNNIIMTNTKGGSFYKFSNLDGTQIWENTSIPQRSSSGNDFYTDITLSNDGSIIFANNNREYNTGFYGSDASRRHIYKINSDGTLDWESDDLDDNGPNRIGNPAADNQGNIYIAAGTGSNTSFLIKLNSSGVEQWVFQITPYSALYEDLIIDSDGNIIVVNKTINVTAKKVNSNGTINWSFQTNDDGRSINDLRSVLFNHKSKTLFLVSGDNRNRDSRSPSIRSLDTDGGLNWELPRSTIEMYSSYGKLALSGAIYLWSDGQKRLYRVSSDGNEEWRWIDVPNSSGNYVMII